ncbi:glycosyltransferase [Limimaricola sp. ASW11-118]|uniref:Glycosyltransferase n=1 Tax=Limimaricola litoreus TaxID=2955316 RepID=A0A9X2FQ48_9RHOB|nr:glycosyltransferase [Limimaricola litoreus]MCP1169436.1 glycosyltransferase [Limimaricola litoreus]
MPSNNEGKFIPDHRSRVCDVIVDVPGGTNCNASFKDNRSKDIPSERVALEDENGMCVFRIPVAEDVNEVHYVVSSPTEGEISIVTGYPVQAGQEYRQHLPMLEDDKVKVFVPRALQGVGRFLAEVTFFDIEKQAISSKSRTGVLSSLEKEKREFLKFSIPKGAISCEAVWSIDENVTLSDLPHFLNSYYSSYHRFECRDFQLPKLAFWTRAKIGKFTGNIQVRFFCGDQVLHRKAFGFQMGENGWQKKTVSFAHPGGIKLDEQNFPVPFGATHGEIFVSVDRRARLEPQPRLYFRSTFAESQQLEQPELDQGPDILMSTTAGPYRDNVLKLRSHYITDEFVRHGYRTWYVPLGGGSTDRVDSETFIQFERRRFLELAKRAITGGRPGIFFCSSLCDAEAVLSVDAFKRAGWTVVYEVRDDMEAMRAAGFSKWYAPELESKICLAADAIICVSKPIHARMIALGADPATTYTIPNGISAEELDFAQTTWKHRSNTTRRKVGYFGHLFPGRFDVDAVREAAIQHADVSFDIIGPGLHPVEALNLPNVTLYGQQPISFFKELSQSWDVGILPFKDNRLTFSLDPIKYYQYLAAGLKVVSSDVFALRGRPLTEIYGSGVTLGDTIGNALQKELSVEDGQNAVGFLEESTWAMRWKSTMSILDGLETMPRKGRFDV